MVGTTGWAVQLRWPDARATVALRLEPGLSAARDGDAFWLLGAKLTESLTQQIRQLPLEGWYEIHPDGQLVPQGRRVPTRRLPVLDWRPLRDWWRLEVPPASLPGRAAGRVTLRLVRSGSEREPDAILLGAGEWRAYVETVSAVRLKPLAFALCEDGRTLVIGRPLPPVAGVRLTETEGVLVPCGFHWVPAVDARLVRYVLKLEPGERALWSEQGDWERIAEGQFVRATRSAVRRSVGGGS